MTNEDEPTIVEATGQAATVKASAKEMEAAMAAAVEKAYAEGITDPDEVRRLQLEARDRVRKQLG
jgi:hypothetical protein